MKSDSLLDLMNVDWVDTRYGSLFHIAANAKLTLCGRIAFEYTDAPWCWWNGRACTICVRRARSRLSPPSTTVTLSS